MEEYLVNGLKKALWMVGRRSGGWLEEDLVYDRKKIWWLVERRSGG
jgi:hypothetical protein